MDPELSVIIPCFNHGNYLLEALASIDKSKFRDQIEIIIVNDGSNDNYTNKVINNLDTLKYVVINQKNQGLAKSRNKGILMSHADYVLILDADNYIDQNFMVDFFKIRKKGIVLDTLYGNGQCFGMHNNLMTPGPLDLFKLINRNYIDACAIFRKKCLHNIGYYDENMPHMGWEDWDLWLRLAFSNADFKYSNRTYYYYRVLENSMIRSKNNHAVELTFGYVYKKNSININNIERILENYINKYVSYKTIIRLLLKKMKINRNYKFKIHK